MKTFKSFITEKKLTLEFHKELNSKFWNENKELDKEVKDKLLEIANAWAEYANIEAKDIKDVYLLGGNCNYNYTKYSDLDIHLVIDMDKISCDRDLLFLYYMDKKNIWGENHDITVKGYPVEIFAQDYKDEPKIGQGVYSLKYEKWIQEPTREDVTRYKASQIKHKVIFYTALINKALKGKMSLDEIAKLKEKIRLMRKAGIEKGGEYSFENLVFKEIRNRNLLTKLNNYKKEKIDKMLSLEGGKTMSKFKQYLEMLNEEKSFKNKTKIPFKEFQKKIKGLETHEQGKLILVYNKEGKHIGTYDMETNNYMTD